MSSLLLCAVGGAGSVGTIPGGVPAGAFSTFQGGAACTSASPEHSHVSQLLGLNDASRESS